MDIRVINACTVHAAPAECGAQGVLENADVIGGSRFTMMILTARASVKAGARNSLRDLGYRADRGYYRGGRTTEVEAQAKHRQGQDRA